MLIGKKLMGLNIDATNFDNLNISLRSSRFPWIYLSMVFVLSGRVSDGYRIANLMSAVPSTDLLR